MIEALKWTAAGMLAGVILLIWVYLAARLVAWAAARSWFEFRKTHREETTEEKGKEE